MTWFRFKLVVRLLKIQTTLIRHGLDEFVWRTHLFRPIAWVQRMLPRRRARHVPLGVRIRLALEELGPLFVKFGQALSVRRDLLPTEIADELEKLQDHVPPFPSEQAVAMLEQALGAPLAACFAEFDREPLAAASIAQVHKARLLAGQLVVVKLLRPNVRDVIERDVEILYVLAELAEAYWPRARRLHPIDVVAEFERTLQRELDLMREAASAAQLRKNFEGSEKLYIPEVYWDYCRPNVLTLERVEGVPIADVETLREQGVDIKRLAENGVEIFFTQVFRHNFFHADMHPGNIFVDTTVPERPVYVAVDFGIIGTLSAQDQRYLAENFVAFFKRDYRRVAALHIESGWVPPETRIDELESAVRAVCEPIFDKPLKDISFGLVLMRLLQTAREFDMELQPQLVLLQKTLLSIEGLGRELYPDLDLWSTAKPILEQWMRERKDPRALARRLHDAWPDITEDLLLVPELLHKAIRDVDRRRDAERSAELARARAPAGRRARSAQLAAAVVLVAGVLWTGLDAEPLAIGWIAAGAGLAWLLAATRSVARAHGR